MSALAKFDRIPLGSSSSVDSNQPAPHRKNRNDISVTCPPPFIPSGFQAGAQSFGYAVFLMNDRAVRYLNRSGGWEIGVGPTVVVVDEGAAKNLSTSMLKDDAYAFIFDQKGG